MIRTRPRPLTIISRLRPAFKPKRLPGREALSISVAIRCQNGIVLSADREMSAGDFKYYESKIYGVTFANGNFMVAQAAKDVDDIPRFFERVSKKIENQSKGEEEIRQDVEAVLSDLREWNPDNTDHQTLIALSIPPNKLILWKSANAKVIPVYQPWAIIGFGESSLTHYLMKVLFKSGMDLTMAQAAIYGIYIINQAKQHIAGCGSHGQTDVACLKTDGQVVAVPTVYVDAIERHWELIEYQSSIALAKITDRRLQLADLKENALKEFADFLEVMHMNVKSIEL